VDTGDDEFAHGTGHGFADVEAMDPDDLARGRGDQAGGQSPLPVPGDEAAVDDVVGRLTTRGRGQIDRSAAQVRGTGEDEGAGPPQLDRRVVEQRFDPFALRPDEFAEAGEGEGEARQVERPPQFRHRRAAVGIGRLRLVGVRLGPNSRGDLGHERLRRGGGTAVGLPQQIEKATVDAVDALDLATAEVDAHQGAIGRLLILVGVDQAAGYEDHLFGIEDADRGFEIGGDHRDELIAQHGAAGPEPVRIFLATLVEAEKEIAGIGLAQLEEAAVGDFGTGREDHRHVDLRRFAVEVDGLLIDDEELDAGRGLGVLHPGEELAQVAGAPGGIGFFPQEARGALARQRRTIGSEQKVGSQHEDLAGKPDGLPLAIDQTRPSRQGQSQHHGHLHEAPPLLVPCIECP